uniref:Zinc finger, CCHC-type n=1 Tax=Tanacetum cinerariifolium TaxID=118510 RepID=A0A6L2L6N5_TANCI|nr:zinc finger, CCHC-type [Tanacetum cinerariifolium]
MVVAAMKHMASNFAKLDKFEGVDFRIWQKKMHFLLSSISVVYVLTTPIPEDGGDNPTAEQVSKRAKWDNNDYVCRGLILNGNNVAAPSVVNMVKHNNSSRYNEKKGKRKHHDNTRANPNKNAKSTCWKCDKTGHIKRDCKDVNIGNKATGSSTKGLIDSLSKSLKGANCHVCKDRCWFKTYESLNDGSILHMRNESPTLVHGRGCVDRRLGHDHFKRMQDMSKDGFPAFDMDTKKYKTCMMTKITKKSFQNVKHETEVLKLIHSDLCDLHATPSLGNKKYFVTFIDDAVRFCYVYLLHSKDEALDKFKDSKEVIEEVVQQSELELRKSKRNRTPKNFGPEFQLYLIEGTRDEVCDRHSYCFNFEDDPKTFDEVMKLHDVAFWKEAINDEMDSILGNNTWVLADLPPCCKPFGCKWIFKRKLKMDVKTTFLNGELDDEVYMNQPQGFIMPGNENKVCKLIKSLYGLKQAPKQWHQKFDEMVLSNGYLLNQADKCVYSKFDKTEADVILGIRIKHESNGIAISQSHCIEKVLKKFNYFDITLVSTPTNTSKKLMLNNSQAASQLGYTSNPAAGKKAEWLKNLLLEILLWSKPIAPISIRCDGVATLAKAYSQMYNVNSRHLGVKHSMIRERITNGVVSIEFVRIIPGPAGIVQTDKLRKLADTWEGGEESVMSTQKYIRKVIKDVGEDNDFTSATWLSVLEYVNVDGGIVTGCFGDVKKVVAVTKSCTPNALGDLTITLKELFGIISGTIHYKVLTKERFEKAITVGTDLILHNDSVFSPNQSTHHYLNITKKNMIKVFHKDGGSA